LGHASIGNPSAGADTSVIASGALNNASYCSRSTAATATWAIMSAGVARPHKVRTACTLSDAPAPSNRSSAASTNASPSSLARCSNCT